MMVSKSSDSVGFFLNGGLIDYYDFVVDLEDINLNVGIVLLVFCDLASILDFITLPLPSCLIIYIKIIILTVMSLKTREALLEMQNGSSIKYVSSVPTLVDPEPITCIIEPSKF